MASQTMHRERDGSGGSDAGVGVGVGATCFSIKPRVQPLLRTLSIFVLILLLSTSSLAQNARANKKNIPKGQTTDKIPYAELENWAVSFGTVLWETARVATRFDAVKEKFHSDGAKVEPTDGFTMVKQMADDVMTMMQHKIDAIKRIMEFAENLALGHAYDKDLGHRLKVSPQEGGYHYINSKKVNVFDKEIEEDRPDKERYLNAFHMNKQRAERGIGYSTLTLESNAHFSGIPVNTNISSVHVPTNVFDGDPNVINAIDWSLGLDPVFLDNYNRDPSLSWQYFGSSTGFMRQYPAMKWLTSKHDPDLYDGRMREWYIKSAVSPKELVILLDTSGSMTGLRKEVAKHVVLNILETLGEDDFIAIYKFAGKPEPLVDCFKTADDRAELVQATNENIRMYQEAVNLIETEDIANFTSALINAFELLAESRHEPSIGANCNQAIMLVTDGVPYRLEELFKLHNNPHKPVRVFTYLIGREISDLKAANWIACQNRGYFTHVTTLAEVKEQVLKYIPVMARPMVMYRNKHPIQWTGVYADVEDPKTSRWLWDLRERERQKKRTEHYREILHMQQDTADPLENLDMEEESQKAKEHYKRLTRLDDPVQLENYLSYGKWDLNEKDIARLEKDEKIKQRLIREITDAKTQKWTIPPKQMTLKIDKHELRKNKFTGYRLMTTVSIPVFDKKNHTDPERVGLKKNPEVASLRKVRIAQLLGVAGTDVPIREIEKLTPPHRLGVNGYSFAINNNGYVLFHPDLRPMFQEILKPNYNSVDLAEVELPMNFREQPEPRANDSELLSMRRDMVNQVKGQTYMTVKQHYDDMKRATLRTLDYFYYPLINTPFTLGIALPQDTGKYQVKGSINVPLARFNISSLFADDNWRLHPDWVFCQYNYAGDETREFETPEETMKHFFARMQKKDWTWGTPSVRPLPICTNQEKHFNPNCIKSHGMDKMDKTSHVCNQELVESMVFDAVVTHNFEKMKSPRHGNAPSRFTAGPVNPLILLFDLLSSDEIYKRVGIQMGFIATRSGLMRFSDHTHLFKDPQEEEERLKRKKKRRKKKLQAQLTGIELSDEEEEEMVEKDVVREPHFADINNKATDEIWYRRAVDYHKINPNAFLYSIPFDVGERKTTVMATHAIMVGRGSQKTPAAVAGMQIDYAVFREMFFNETKKCVGRICNKTCASEDLECYVIDNNGFVIISEDPVHTGKFFGEVDGAILESLIRNNIYREIKIFDYQAICLEDEGSNDSASFLLTPFRFMAWAFNFILGQMAWVIINFEIRNLWNPDWTYAFPADDYVTMDYVNNDYGQMDAAFYDQNTDYPFGEDNPFMDSFAMKDGSPFIPLLNMTYIQKTVPKPCDKEVTLYELNEQRLLKILPEGAKPVPVKGKLTNCHESDCERPFSAQLIPHTNLVLIVADNLCPCFSTKISIEPTKVIYDKNFNTGGEDGGQREEPKNSTAYCERLKYNIYRRKPIDCFGYHPEESEIKLCGRGCLVYLTWIASISSLFAQMYTKFIL